MQPTSPPPPQHHQVTCHATYTRLSQVWLEKRLIDEYSFLLKIYKGTMGIFCRTNRVYQTRLCQIHTSLVANGSTTITINAMSSKLSPGSQQPIRSQPNST